MNYFAAKIPSNCDSLDFLRSAGVFSRANNSLPGVYGSARRTVAEWPKATVASLPPDVQSDFSLHRLDFKSSRPVLCHVTSGEEARKKMSLQCAAAKPVK